MITYRQRGLANAYSVFANVVAVALLPTYAALLPSLTYVQLSENVNLLPYGCAVFFGMAGSSGHIRRNHARLHALSRWTALGIAFRQMLYVAAFIFAYMFASKDREISRLFLGSYLLLLTGLLTLMHARVPRDLASLLFGDGSKMPTLFIGRGDRLGNLDEWITNRMHVGVQPVGFLADEPPSRAELAIAPYLGCIDQLASILHEKRIGQVILLEWFDDSAKVEEMIELCEQEGCRFLIHNNYGAQYARTFIPLEEGGLHFMSLQNEPLEDPVNRAAKRLLDIAISLPVVVFILPPLCGLVWVVQRMQAPGPVFFAKPRGGRARTEFNMLKFRSMYARDHDINQQATSGDSRIYPFGRILRKTSLDEFPQFINVLLGDMSVVGPRPHLPQHDIDFSQISKNYRVRSLVKPGITGLAQVNGYRGEIDDPEKLHRRVYWDLYYVSNWALWLDVQIILRTAWQVVSPPKTAY
jgi:exopolysaccharide biosynthesis polyprenyl glycosylphosphotransferase